MKHNFDVLSNKRCQGFCGKNIKQNLIDKKPNAKYCFGCFRVLCSGGDTISTAREVRTGKRIGRKKGIYSPV